MSKEKPEPLFNIERAIVQSISDSKAMTVILRNLLMEYKTKHVKVKIIYDRNIWQALKDSNDCSDHCRAFTVQERGKVKVYLRDGFSTEDFAHECAHVLQVLNGLEMKEGAYLITYLEEVCAMLRTVLDVEVDSLNCL